MLTFTLLASLILHADKPVPIGTIVGAVTFKDIRYLPRSLDDFKDKKAFVLVFIDKSCPVSQKYLPVLKQLDERFGPRGIQFLAVNANPEDSITDVAAHALNAGMTFPFVKDFDGKAARVLGVERVPTAVLLSRGRVLLYRGRIDDAVRISGTRPEPTRSDLLLALEDCLAGKPVAVPETVVDGCPITFPDEAKPDRTISYAEHVRPILQKHCMDCHKPGTVAPFSLLTYEQTKSKAAVLAEVVREGRMPPWFAHPDYDNFANKRRLTDEERETILDWVKQGRPAGDLSKLAPLPESLTKLVDWQVTKPDLILSTASYDLPASGDVEYKYAILPHVFTEDTWISEIQIRPENSKVVHHANLAFFVVGKQFSMNNFLTGYVPGGIPMRLDPGVAAMIPKGSILGLQIHFVTTGKPEKGKVNVGLRLARGEVTKQLHFALLADRRFAIPPGAPAHPVKASWTMPQDVIGIGLFSHMHVRGRDMTFTATEPNKDPETLLQIPNYSFDWQIAYAWSPGTKKFPAGTKLDCLAHYDNSPFNPYNPNPDTTIREGQQTYEEMMNGFFFYVLEKENLGIKIEGETGQAKK